MDISNTGKPKIFFVPPHIAALKYYERLIPYLVDKYDVGFLLVRHNGILLSQMPEYCQRMGYPFHILKLGLKKGGVRVPFVTPLWKIFAHEKACREFIKNVRPAKLIFEKTTNPMSQLAYEAKCLGVETIVLQWCYLASPQVARTIVTTINNPAPQPYILRMYNYIFLFIYTIAKKLLGQNKPNQERHVVPKKLGLFEGHMKRRFVTEPEIVRDVGNLDVQVSHELVYRIQSDVLFKKALQSKYAINSQKKNILVFSSRIFSSGLKRDEYASYYRNIFSSIRTIFSPNEAQILFKMHPKEDPNMIHVVCNEFNASLFYIEADPLELVCLSDLCISDAISSVNYYIFGSDTPAIFINLSQFTKLDIAKDGLKIKNVVHSRKHLEFLIKKFKTGCLEKQYHNTLIELQAREKIIELINI